MQRFNIFVEDVPAGSSRFNRLGEAGWGVAGSRNGPVWTETGSASDFTRPKKSPRTAKAEALEAALFRRNSAFEGAFCKPIQGRTKAGSKRRIQPHEADWFLLRHFSGCPGLAQARCMLLVSMQLAMGEAR